MVLLVDVSGSMARVRRRAAAFAHALVTGASRGRTEVFTLGTRLTRITRELRHRDPEHAMSAVVAGDPGLERRHPAGRGAAGVPGRWHSAARRGAIVVIASDGWERGDPALLGAQMARLARLAHRVIWANPHKGHAGLPAAHRRHAGRTAVRRRLGRRAQPGRLARISPGGRRAHA